MWLAIGLIVLAFLGFAFLRGVIEGVQEAGKEARDTPKPRSDAQPKPDSPQAVATVLSPEARALRDKVEALRRDLALPGVRVTVTDRVSEGLTESRLGGRPAWPKGLEKPKAKGRFPLCFLLQIDLSAMPRLDGFPDHGLLQFYFAGDDLYGLAFPEMREGVFQITGDVQVVWHQDVSDMELWDMFPDPDATASLCVPHDRRDWAQMGYALEFAPVRGIPPTRNDFRLYDLCGQLSEAMGYEAFEALEENWFAEQAHGIVLGGHPFFSQMDPRYDYPDLRDYTATLLALDSINGKLMWGDCGTGCFLMRPDSLERRAFDEVLTNYDCL